MARRPTETREQRIRRENEDSYSGYNTDRLKDEILRLLKAKVDHQENKKAQAKSWSDLIKLAEEKITYCSARIDELQHEEAVQNV